MTDLTTWLSTNHEWLFSGVGVSIVGALMYAFRRLFFSSSESTVKIENGAAIIGSTIHQASNVTQNVNSPTINLSMADSRGERPNSRQVEALAKITPRLNDALFYLQRIAAAGRLQGEPNDQEMARRMGDNLAAAAKEFSENELFMTQGLESKVKEFFAKMVSVRIDLGLIFDPMVQDGNLRAKLWGQVRTLAYGELQTVFDSIRTEAKAIVNA